MTVFTAKRNECRLNGSDSVWFDMVASDTPPLTNDGSAILVRELAHYFGTTAVNKKGEEERVYITYQPCYHSAEKRDEGTLRGELLNDLTEKGFIEPEILYQCHWEYFPR